MNVKMGWSHWKGNAVILLRDNIDTDQIYPGRFLSLTDRAEMRDAFFADWQAAASAEKKSQSVFLPDHSVMVAGENFGCGSSREHAAWVMVDHGYRAVLARSFAPIFRQNAVANGIVPIIISQAIYDEFRALQGAKIEVEINLIETQFRVLCNNLGFSKNYKFEIDPFDVHCLCHGIDKLDFLMSRRDATEEYLVQKNKSLHALNFLNLGGTIS